MSKSTIHFISLGCPKNRVDTEIMFGISDEQGYQLVEKPDQAQVIVVNTCGFIESAKQESIETIVEMGTYKEQGNCEHLIVTGCLSQRYPEALAEELPEVDHFLGSSDMLKLRTLLTRDGRSKTKPERLWVGNPADYTIKASDPRKLSQGQHSAYVKIAEGCARKCSFCSIPSFRGTQRSRPIEDVVAETQRLVDQGTTEINLISQDTIGYGRDFKNENGMRDGTGLFDLVEAITKVDRLQWLRLFYLYPEKVTPELIDLIANHEKIVPYIDMPLQHASDAMLTRMRRGHGGDRLRKLVDHVRQIPNLSFRTAFIIGHPGETDQDFQELCDFVEWAKFEHVGTFLYSHEEGTHSGTMLDRVPENLAIERRDHLLNLQRNISRQTQKRFIGQELTVMIEGVSDESELLLEGRHAGQAPEIDGKVILAYADADIHEPARPGQLVQARIGAASDYDLIGDILPNSAQNTPLGMPQEPGRLTLPIIAE